MFFRLLCGVHRELNTVYEVKLSRDAKGALIPGHQPVVSSTRDLVAAFGSDKFQRLTDDEARILLRSEEVTEREVARAGGGDSAETEVAVAAKQGAVAIAEPPGKDVTDKIDGASAVGLRVYRVKKDAYLVTDSQGDLVTAAGEITKRQLVELIKQYTE
jgi:hypothetical protein